MFQADLLKDKRVLVTGGGSGLGRAMGRRFLDLGAQLVVCGRREAVLEEARSAFDGDFPGRTRAIACDIRDADAVEAMVAEIPEDKPEGGMPGGGMGDMGGMGGMGGMM